MDAGFGELLEMIVDMYVCIKKTTESVMAAYAMRSGTNEGEVNLCVPIRKYWRDKARGVIGNSRCREPLYAKNRVQMILWSYSVVWRAHTMYLFKDGRGDGELKVSGTRTRLTDMV